MILTIFNKDSHKKGGKSVIMENLYFYTYFNLLEKDYVHCTLKFVEICFVQNVLICGIISKGKKGNKEFLNHEHFPNKYLLSYLRINEFRKLMFYFSHLIYRHEFAN